MKKFLTLVLGLLIGVLLSDCTYGPRDYAHMMKDQVTRLNSLEVKSMAIHSGLSGEEIDIALENCIYGDYKFLYISFFHVLPFNSLPFL